MKQKESLTELSMQVGILQRNLKHRIEEAIANCAKIKQVTNNLVEIDGIVIWKSSETNDIYIELNITSESIAEVFDPGREVLVAEKLRLQEQLECINKKLQAYETDNN